MNTEQLHMVRHALGIEYADNGKQTQPNKSYRPKIKSHRNHYQTDDCEVWNGLVDLNYAIKSKSLGMNYYFVTKEGIAKLKEMGYIFQERIN